MYTGGFDVMFYVSDLKRSVAFWRDVLGVTFKGFWDDETHEFADDLDRAGPDVCYVTLDAGGQMLALHSTPDEVKSGGAVYHLEVEDVDALHTRIREHGLEATEPEDMPWRWRMTFVNDPDGHCIGLYRPIEGAGR